MLCIDSAVKVYEQFEGRCDPILNKAPVFIF